MKRVTISVLLAGLLLAACSDASKSAGPQDLTVEGKEFAFSPASLEVVAGRPVRLTFKNNGTLEHDFSIMEFPMEAMGATAEPMAGHDMGQMEMEPELHMAATMGMSNSMEVTPSKPGTYEFVCTVAGHKDVGMRGTLVVKAP